MYVKLLSQDYSQQQMQWEKLEKFVAESPTFKHFDNRWYMCLKKYFELVFISYLCKVNVVLMKTLKNKRNVLILKNIVYFNIPSFNSIFLHYYVRTACSSY